MADLTPIWRMPTRAQAKEILIVTRSRIEDLVQGLGDKQLKTRAALGGGEWSIKDLLGHLAGYEEQAVGVATGKKPRFDFSKFDSVDERNAADVARKRSWSVNRVREDLEKRRRALLDTIDEMDDERWVSKIQTRNGRSSLGLVLGRLLVGGRFGLYAHDLDHIKDLMDSVDALRPA